MERKKASDFDPELLGLFHRYVHGGLSRREFLDGAAKFAVGGLNGGGVVGHAQAELRLGAASAQRRQPDQGGVHDVSVSQG